jgi:sigma-B regulation protein RsbU (phosphoserine phosphatase)
VGLFPKIQCEEANLELRPGDLMVAFTDGVPEALNAEGEEYGEERLKELLRESRDCGAEEILARISNQVRDWRGGAARRRNDRCNEGVNGIRAPSCRELA